MGELLYWVVFAVSFILVQGIDRGSVYFVEPGHGHYLQSHNPIEETVFSEADVAASISVLLGVDPPLAMSHSSAEKLEKLLIPNPFHRPRRVVSLVVEGFDADYLKEKNISLALGVRSAEHHLLALKRSKKPAKHLGGKRVRLESLNYPVPENFDLDYLKKELQELFDISVEISSAQQENAEQEIVTLSLGGISLQLDLFKRTDYLFTVDLVSLAGGLKRALAAHKQLAETSDDAELFFGTFSGIKVLKQDRSEEDVSKASDLLLVTLSKLLQMLESSTNGKLVGVIAFPGNGAHHVVRELVGKHYHARRSRLLEKEKKPQTVQTLSRSTLAGCMSIVLIIAALLGSWCMCYMPITRDSLLYSGAKLD